MTTGAAGLAQAALGRRRSRAQECGSVLIIVLWIAFGLVSLALFFGHSMLFEFRASDNSTAGYEAQQAIEGAARYVGYTLTNVVEPGALPDLDDYESEAVPVGDATFWLLGRDSRETTATMPYFGLIDEASKLNLNTATLEMLELLPRMTPELAAAIVDWRDEDDEVTSGGAESELYLRRNPAYACKNAAFETTEELRLVSGAEDEILYGEDLNRNGVLDPNENDGDLSPPSDNRDGRLDPGLLEYVTVYSREPNKRSDGSARISVNEAASTNLTALLRETFGDQRANQIQGGLGATSNYGSLLEFFIRSGMTEDEFEQISGELTVTNVEILVGLVNVNTASEAVLACLPGIGTEKAPQVVAARSNRSEPSRSVAWVAQVLGEEGALQAGPYLTAQSWQFTADVAAVGHYARGYRRTMFVIDTSEDASKVLYRRDLGRLGWALGTEVRQSLLLAMENRRWSH